MNDKIIDLRSDTVTKPSPAMRRAMAEAEVGDDVYLEDPTVNRLQSRAAEIFGREAGLFVPSGSMGNLACIMAQTSRGQEVVCEAAGHIYNYEMASMTALGGVLPRLVAGSDGILTWDKIVPAIREKVYYRPQTTLISLENTHNMAGGTVYPTEVAEEICDRAHEAGISVHLDGARIFNAAVYLRQDVAAITKKFDSVQFCLSKGLGAPVGSLIVGSKILSIAAGLFARCWAAVCGRLVCWAARAWWPWKRGQNYSLGITKTRRSWHRVSRGSRAFKSIRQKFRRISSYSMLARLDLRQRN